MEGQTFSLVPPPLLITWNSHLDSVTDILYVNSFQLVVSAGQDRDVKAWRLSGDAIGTFGLNLWKRLQEAAMVDELEQGASLEKKPATTGATLKHSFLEMDKELAEALVYQRREQAVLLAFLRGRAEKETEAWSKLQQMSLTSPWTKSPSVEDIEESWTRWTKDKQISPQVYQCLSFTDLKPIQQPDFMMHKILDQAFISLSGPFWFFYATAYPGPAPKRSETPRPDVISFLQHPKPGGATLVSPVRWSSHLMC